MTFGPIVWRSRYMGIEYGDRLGCESEWLHCGILSIEMCKTAYLWVRRGLSAFLNRCDCVVSCPEYFLLLNGYFAIVSESISKLARFRKRAYEYLDACYRVPEFPSGPK